jgi:hypothetical protein
MQDLWTGYVLHTKQRDWIKGHKASFTVTNSLTISKQHTQSTLEQMFVVKLKTKDRYNHELIFFLPAKSV